MTNFSQLSQLCAKNPYSPQEISEIFRRFSQQNPQPKSELEYKDPYTLLIAVLLSAQATDKSVNKATQLLFSKANTPQAMCALSEEEIGFCIRSIGLWRNKAKNIRILSQILCRSYNGQVPQSRDALMRLPGVGRKTANVVLNIAFAQDTFAVDTHIFRLGNRLGLAPGATPEEVEEAFIKIIPPAFLKEAHHWLILHGRYVCKARKPACGQCLISDLCKAPIKNTLHATQHSSARAQNAPLDATSRR